MQTAYLEQGIQLDHAGAIARVRQFVTIQPPEVSLSSIGLVILRAGGVGGGSSVRPGNITLNIRKVATAASAGGPYGRRNPSTRLGQRFRIDGILHYPGFIYKPGTQVRLKSAG